MKRFLTCIASGVLALGVAGCGDSGVTEGTVPFKATDTKQFDEMKKQMMGNVKGPTPRKAAAEAEKAPEPAAPEKKD